MKFLWALPVLPAFCSLDLVGMFTYIHRSCWKYEVLTLCLKNAYAISIMIQSLGYDKLSYFATQTYVCVFLHMYFYDVLRSRNGSRIGHMHL